ncbi:PiggyBac transposable element-derived protein 4 [Folsomia candida]|uniref:PiggyBac transposable element-derived protein 4 n=1 Tax=Folsomia candida TaxID=158441 RepID=A0A226DN49_FOLCA|nr:PiggyBac transposable element-derived protein 4 [Folsomia candida]
MDPNNENYLYNMLMDRDVNSEEQVGSPDMFADVEEDPVSSDEDCENSKYALIVIFKQTSQITSEFSGPLFTISDLQNEDTSDESDPGEDDDESADPALASPALTAGTPFGLTGCTAPWQWQTDPNFKADVSDFDDTISGWTIPFSRTETELDLFLKLFTKEIRQEVIQQTNTYADQTGDCSTRRWSNWRELDEQDLLKLIAVRMLMGVTRLPEMKQYWSRDPLLQYPIITRIMKQDRYFEILKTFGYGGAIVLKLLEPYLNNGHHLYCDNYFTSPNLAKYLLERTTYICGTLRKNRKHTDPPPVRGPNKMKPGEIIVKSCQGVMTEYWRDKKVVSMISTSHDHSMVSVPQRYGGGVVMKPKTVLDYNKYARGTDYSDMMKKFYNIRRKSMKWHEDQISIISAKSNSPNHWINATNTSYLRNKFFWPTKPINGASVFGIQPIN